MNALRPDWYSTRIQLCETASADVGVVIVANVKEKTTPLDDYDGDSIITEFLSNQELDDIVEYFESAGLYCDVLIDEQRFLNWLVQGRPFPRRHAVVYNLAQNGTGPARLTTVAALCRLNRLPLVDSEAYGVALAQHKFHSLSLLSHFGMPVARCWSFGHNGWWPNSPPLDLKLIAKPTFDSASIGVDHASVFQMTGSCAESLLERVKRYRQPLTVQEFVSGYEIEVPVFGADAPQTIAAIGIDLQGRRQLGDEVLTYSSVFDDEYGFYDFADEDPNAANEAMRISRQAFSALGLIGIGRVDFRITSSGRPFIMEVNCKPHITKHSGFMHALSLIGCSGSDLAKYMVGFAVERHNLIG
jgi:D-alanine-D-alanine ligase